MTSTPPLPAPRRRAASRAPISLPLAAALALALVWPADAPAASPRRIALSSGATVEGTILKELDDAVIIDLGHDVLRIPRAQIDTIHDPAEDAADAPEAAADAMADASASAGSIPFLEVGPRYGAQLTSKEMIARSRLGVVLIQSPSKFGSGFIINKQGYIVSNHHVVDGERFVDVTVYHERDGRLQRKKYEGVELIAFSALMDISILRIPEEQLDPDLLNPLPVARPGSDRQGDTSFVIGNPGMGAQALEHTVSEGIVSSTERNLNDVVYWQTTAAINPGNSGGPMINRNGEVIGLVTFKASFQEGIGFTLPVSYIRYFIENHRAFAYPEDKQNTGFRYLPPVY